MKNPAKSQADRSVSLAALKSVAVITLFFVGEISLAIPWEPIFPEFPEDPPPPTPGAIVGPSTDADGTYTLSWGPSFLASLYHLQEYSTTWTNVQTNATRSYTAQNRAPGQYRYRVRACNIFGCSGYTAQKIVTVTQPSPPPTPGAISGPGTDDDGAFALSWSAASGATSYTLQQRINSGAWSNVQNTAATSFNASGLGDGTYEYRVRACNADGCSGFTATKSVVVSIPDPTTPPGPAGSNDPGPSLESDQIGTTEGSFRVNENGAASYSIPITATAGTAGVAPTISLNYSGTTQNGIAGVGWSIGGLSSIARCRQTREQDHDARAISWSSTDRFCLDGSRLLLDTGASYGAANSTYRTEVDSGAVVTIKGSVNGEPNYFEVWREDGSLSYYGRSASSSSEQAELKAGNNKTLTWGIRQYKDSIGNSIWFDYETGSTALRIKNIRYAYAAAAGPSGNNARIEFIYAARNDKISGYVAGYKFTNTKRLTNIRSYNRIGGTEYRIRDYVLLYGAGPPGTPDKLSRLKSIQECANGACLPKTSFKWRVPSPVFVNSTIASLNIHRSYSSLTPADINGDSMMDLVWLQGGGATKTLRYAVSTGTGLTVKSFSGGGTGISLRVGSDPQKLQAIDYNVDGRQDIAYFDNIAKKWKIVLSEPYGDGEWRLKSTPVTTPLSIEQYQDAEVTFMDVDSNGTADAVYRGSLLDDRLRIRLLERNPSQADSSATAYRFGAEFSPSGANADTMIGKIIPVTPDFNGDGQVDFLISGVDALCSGYIGNHNCNVVNNNRRAILLQGIASGSPSVSSYYNFPISGGRPQLKKLQSVDVNSDGLSDVFYPVGSYNVGAPLRYLLRVNRGDGVFTQITVSDTSLLQDVARPAFVDWNMDGYPDLLWKDRAAGGRIMARYWNPSTEQLDSAVVIAYSASTNNNEIALYFDMNGDAAPDILYVNQNGTIGSLFAQTRRYQGTVANVATNRIEKITNGLGAVTDIAYEPLSTTDHYDRLELTTSTETATFCETEPGFGTFCYDQEIQVPNAGEFYAKVNGAWDLPEGSQTLGKNSPVLEMVGPYYVVTDVTGSAPSAGSSPNQVNTNAKSTLSYRYGEAKLQAAGRGFLGFERLTTIDNQSLVETTTRYRQDWPFVGSPIATDVRSGNGRMLSSTTTDWEILEWSAAYETNYQQNGSAVAGSIHIVQAGGTEKSYDLVSNGAAQGVLLSTVETTSAYDAEANATSIVVNTKDGNGATIQSVTTSNAYNASTFALREGRLTRTTVTTTRAGQSTPLTRKSTFAYIASGPQRGLLRAEVIEPNKAEYKLHTRHAYDSHGNRVRSRVLGGSVTRCDVNTRVFDATGRYVDRQRDCLGRTTNVVTARNEFGQAVSADTYVDTNDTVESISSYGALGRPYYSYTATGASTTSFFHSSTTNCPAGTAFKSTTLDAGGAQTAECVDKLGRTIRDLTIAFDGTWNAQNTEYDASGRVKRKSEPFNLSYDGPTTTLWTTFAYDILGRATLTTLPDASTGAVSYSGLTTTTTNNLGQSKLEVRNVLGEITDVNDNLGGHTHYEYDHQGNLTLVRDNANNETVTEFDLLGRKQFVNDPDKGLWQYEYNHFGELELQTDAKLQTSTISYDGLGRTVSRIDRTSSGSIEANTVWVYDTAAYGLGQLDYVQDQVSGYHKAILYDTLGRGDEFVTSFAGGVYYEKTTYDAYGRVSEYFDAAGNGAYTDFGVKNSYNNFGYLSSIADVVKVGGSPRTIYQKIESMNSRGQVTVEKRGIPNGSSTAAVSILYSYWNTTGRIKDIDATNSSGFDVQDLEYVWDTIGNLTSRKEFSGSKNLQESFGYDALNRLTNYGAPGERVTVTYDPQHIGNIRTKSDTSGTYQYGANGAGPHAVTRFNGSNYFYDANGNNTSGGGRSIGYTTFDQASSISKGGHTTQFSYDPSRSRYRRVDTDGSGTTSTLYLGSVEIIHLPNGHQKRKRHIGGVAIETNTYIGGSLSTRTTEYLFHDHLGSVDVVTNSSGEIVQEQSFDAWGQRRNATNWRALTIAQRLGFNHDITTRGFTGHEMVDEVGIVHMNGRIYDPNMGRFLQADPFVQDPTNSQSLNRYSYVWNNPLNATDPSGYFIFTLLAMILVAADIGINAVIAFAAAGFLDAVVAGADIADAFLSGIISGFSAAAFSAVGEAIGTNFGGDFVGQLSGEGFAIKIFAHGAIGGITSVMQGGKFGHGFASAFATASATSFNNSQFVGKSGFSKLRVVIGAAIGGSVSKLSGGKFANGAITGAFSQALNKESMEEKREQQRIRIAQGRKKSSLLHPRGKFDTLEDAALAAAESIWTVERGAKALNNPSAFGAWITKHDPIFGADFFTFTPISQEVLVVGASNPPSKAVGWIRGEGAKIHRNQPSMLSVPSHEIFSRMGMFGLTGFFATNNHAVRMFNQQGSSPNITRSCSTIRGPSIPGC